MQKYVWSENAQVCGSASLSIFMLSCWLHSVRLPVALGLVVLGITARRHVMVMCSCRMHCLFSEGVVGAVEHLRSQIPAPQRIAVGGGVL